MPVRGQEHNCDCFLVSAIALYLEGMMNENCQVVLLLMVL